MSDDSYILQIRHEAACIETNARDQEYRNACAAGAPSMLLKPRIFIDGNKWCALYGENLQDGVGGFGDSPAEAYADFDKRWTEKLPAVAPQPEQPQRPCERGVHLGNCHCGALVCDCDNCNRKMKGEMEEQPEQPQRDVGELLETIDDLATFLGDMAKAPTHINAVAEARALVARWHGGEKGAQP